MNIVLKMFIYAVVAILILKSVQLCFYALKYQIEVIKARGFSYFLMQPFHKKRRHQNSNIPHHHHRAYDPTNPMNPEYYLNESNSPHHHHGMVDPTNPMNPEYHHTQSND